MSKEHALFYGTNQSGAGGPGAVAGSRVNPRATQDERARELGVELEPGPGPVTLVDGTTEYQEARFVITPRPKEPEPPAPLTLDAMLDDRVAAAEALVTEREAERIQADARLANAAQARADSPRDAGTLVELEAAERAAHVAQLDVQAATKARDQARARADKLRKTGKLAALQKLADQQTDLAVTKLVEGFAQRASDAAKQFGQVVTDGLAAMGQVAEARRQAEHLARGLEFNDWRPGRADQGLLITRVASAFAAGFQASTKLPFGAGRNWVGR